MRNLILKILIASASLMACDADTIIIDRPNDGGQDVDNCNQEVIINSELFDIASDNRLTINELTIEDDCLKLNYSSSGCNSDNWIVSLIDSGNVLESFPIQRNLEINFINDELCLAFFIEEITFDISSLQVEGNDSVILNIGDDNSIIYEY